MSQAQLIWNFPLKPISGTIFQPTGFPDIGPAEFKRPTKEGASEIYLLVESAQSMANHLESTLWDTAKNSPIELIAKLPWIRVIDDNGNFLTSSRLEAHRLASAWIKDAQKDNKLMLEVIRDALNLRDNIPLDYRQIAQGIFSLDPMSLIHGVFFADKKWPGQPKIRRALSATIEAANVERVIYGGVKRELVMHKLETDQGGTSEGYGSIPFHRQEFTAKDITLHVNLDVKQLFSYGLSESASKLLEAIAKFQVRTILDDGLRARTSCNLIAVEFSDFESIESLTDQIEQGINDCRDLFPVQGPIDVLHKVKKS